MRSINVLYIIVVACLSTAFGEQTEMELDNCTAPGIVHVPLNELLDTTFYIVWQTFRVGGTCQNLTFKADDDPPTRGTMTINTLNGSSTEYWLTYKSGIFVYKLADNETQPNNYFTFFYYNNKENSPKSFGALVCLDNTYYEVHNNVSHRMPQKQPKNLIVATTASNPSKDHLNELQSQTIETDSTLANITLVSIDQSSCKDVDNQVV